jgi:glycosyltransferase involved in cell wall biosynthesis/O-antigen/teichoic acid export membrane protein
MLELTPPLRSGFLVLLDQAIVSGVSFATTIVVVRTSGPAELAIYALGLTVLLLVGSVHEALIAQPYTVYTNRLDGTTRPAYLGSALGAVVGLAAIAALVPLTIGMLLLGGIGPTRLAPLAIGLAIVAPCWLLRDFARRVSMADLAVGTGLLLDASVALAQLGLLAWLAATGRLSGLTALFAIAAAAAAGGCGWLAVSRRRLRVRPSCFLADWRRNWRLGRWVLAGRVMSQLNSDMTVTWLLMLLAGPIAAGVFAACLTVVFLSNPLVLAAGLFLTPRIARTVAGAGIAAARRIVSQSTVVLAAVLALFVAALALLADPLMQLMYGRQFAGYQENVVLLGVAIAISAVGLAAGSGLLAIERADLGLLSSVCGFVVLIAAAPPLIDRWAVFGAGLALIAGNTVETTARLLLFRRLTRPREPSGRLAFVTSMCPHYRVSTFETLARHHDVDYYFFSDGSERYWQRRHGLRFGAFRHEYLRGFTLAGTRVTPTLPFKLWRGDYDAYIKCINGRFALPVTYLVARLKRKPFILWTGIWARPRTVAHRLFAPATRFIYRHADAIVVYGDHVARFLEGEGVPARRIFVAAQAIDNRSYNRAIAEGELAALRRTLNIDFRLKVVLYLGRLEPEKGLPFLIEAFASLKRHDAVLVIAGTGTQLERLRHLARELRIADRVRFAGYIPVEHTVPYYALAWVYVLPSITTRLHKETWGLVVNEAFNQGVPVIATTAVGAAAGGLVSDGFNGAIVPEADSAALAHTLRGLLDDPAQRSRLSDNARRTIAGWDTERMVSGFRQAIAFALGPRADETLPEPERTRPEQDGLYATTSLRHLQRLAAGRQRDPRSGAAGRL